MSFHHFIGEGLNRSEKIQQWIVKALINSKIPNEQRESSIEWELKHSSGVIQMARLLAQKRNLDSEIAEIAAGLHDVYVIVNGGYKDHAKFGVPIARNLLEESGNFKKSEINTIADAIGNHSDKHIYSKDPYVELIKDADTVDCFFYGDNIYGEKSDETKKHYFRRIILLRRELGLNDKQFYIKELARLGGSL